MSFFTLAKKQARCPPYCVGWESASVAGEVLRVLLHATARDPPVAPTRLYLGKIAVFIPNHHDPAFPQAAHAAIRSSHRRRVRSGTAVTGAVSLQEA